MTLGGVDYIVPPVALAYLEVHGKAIEGLMSGTDPLGPGNVAVVVEVIHETLKRNYPDLPRETVVDFLDIGNFMDIMDSLMDVGGVKRREQAAGKATVPASTGDGSTHTSPPAPDGQSSTSAV